MSDYLPRSSVLMHLQNRTENRRGTTEVLLGTDDTAAKKHMLPANTNRNYIQVPVSPLPSVPLNKSR